MDQIDYACGINCPEDYDDERMLMEFVINDDCEICYLDAYLKDTFSKGEKGAESRQQIGF